MNWLVINLVKEARHRRFKSDDAVRYFTTPRKGTGKGIVLTPQFSKGIVVDYNRDSRRYKVRNTDNEILDIHPRNMFSDTLSPADAIVPEESPISAVPEMTVDNSI